MTSVPSLAEWGRFTDDDWFREVFTNLLRRGTLWGNVVAAVSFSRLRIEPWVHRSVVDLINDPVRRLPWEFARALSAEELGALEILADCEAMRLESLLEGLDKVYEPESPGWLHELRVVCLLREELECVWQALDEASFVVAGSWGKGLGEELSHLDEQGYRFWCNLPVKPYLDDERLRRIELIHLGEAWWALPSVEE